ncbi:hypothetical protein ACHHYP_12514 [Achlya hypogyna]|uniref:Bromodomain-containing protein n=1 Tax=Achlya hypogyna TaxID=1202772 RepID=A0A1V9YGV3_ACHHY|nr:hypothetical protein ACHHYP_12514 [Achlya hypogyna]
MCPVLLGSYTVDENGAATWTGRWAMLESEYAGGITSLFEMKSRGCSKLLDGHGDNVTDEDENRASPGPDEPVKETVVMERTFEGFFQIQTVKGKPNTIPEKDVTLSFYKCDVDHAYLVRGTGENRFGVFTLQGVLDETAKEMRLYKAYKPKDKTPVAKRTRPKPAPVVKAPVTKKPKKSMPGSTPVSEYGSSAPGTPDVEITHVIPPNTKLSSVISISSGSSSPLVSTSRNRSERKRVIPAHLREDAAAERDRAPVMRKCLSILKALSSNPKAVPFLVPVDPVALAIPDYFNVIKDPMDLGTIRSNFDYGVYAEPEYFAGHVRLVFKNAMLYNAPHTQVYVFAQKLLEDFEKKYKAALKSESAAAKKYANLSDGEGSVDSHRAKKSKRASLTKNQEIQSLKQEIEKMKVMVQEMASGKGNSPLGTPLGGTSAPKSTKPRPFKMQDMTEEYLSKPMTAAEKHKLTADLKELPQDKLARVLQIISETVPLHTITQGDDEVELDFNMFDTRCLRMIEGYVREQNIAKKRKRPTKRPTAKGGSDSRLQYAKEAENMLKSRQEQLKSQLAAMQGEVYVPSEDAPAASAPVIARSQTIEQSSSGSSSDSSSSSDDDSDSSSDSDTERPLQKSPSLVSAPAVSSTELTRSALVEADSEPLKVENRSAWSKLATMPRSPIKSHENAADSLWLTARTLEQQKLQKEQLKDSQSFADEIALQKQKEQEARQKEKEREREEVERKKAEQDAAMKQARDARLREAEKALAMARAEEREKLKREFVVDLAQDALFREDMAAFGSASFF